MRPYVNATLVALSILGAAFTLVWFLKHGESAPPEIQTMNHLQKQGMIDFEGILFDWKNPDHKVTARLELSPKKMTVLHFWASWCGPCVDEFPALVKMAAKLKNTVQVIAVSEDQDVAEVFRFLNSLPLQVSQQETKTSQTFGQLMLFLDSDFHVAKTYKVDKLPETFVFDQNRKLIQKFVGPVQWLSAEMRKILEPSVSPLQVE